MQTLALLLCALLLAASSVQAGTWRASAVRPLMGHQVTIETLDGKMHTINVESYKTVLEAALDEGIDMPHDCKLGTCLACAAKVVSGTVDQMGGTLDDSVVEQGYALTCCSNPQSDVTIKCIPEDELVDAQFARA